MMDDSKFDGLVTHKPNAKRHMNSLIYDWQAGETVCSCCGTVVEERQPDSESSAQHSSYKATFHHIANSTMHNLDLGSMVSGNSKISQMMQKYLKDSTRDPRKRRIFSLFVTIDKICKKHGFSKHVQETVCYILRILEKRCLIQDVSREPLIWALVFISLEIADRRMPVRKFLTKYVQKSQHKSFRRNVWKIRTEMKIMPNAGRLALHYLGLHASSLTRSKAIRNVAEEIVSTSYKKGCSDGRDPRVVAATALYLACKMHQFSSTFAETSALFGVSVGAMQRCKNSLSAGNTGAD